MGDCKRCKKYYQNKYDCAECNPDYRITNADRIRAMSDDELAEFIVKSCDNPMLEKNEDMCDFCDKYEDEKAECNEEECKMAVVKWLKSEAEENNGF